MGNSLGLNQSEWGFMVWCGSAWYEIIREVLLWGINNSLNITLQLPSLNCFVSRKFYCPEPNDSFKVNTPPWSKHSPIQLAKNILLLTYTLISKHFASSDVFFSICRIHSGSYALISPLWKVAVGLQIQNAGQQGH